MLAPAGMLSAPCYAALPCLGFPASLGQLTPSVSITPGACTAVSQQNLVLPSDTMKLDSFEYDVRLNASPKTVAKLNDLPIKQVGNSTISLRDVAQVSDGFDPQTNIVRHDGQRGTLLRGSFITVRGQLATMRTSYRDLLGGLVFSIVLVYLLIVVNFQSWLDPFIIITALPAALAGIVLCLFLTHTTLSVPALMGAILCMGVATANSILVVSFARERLLHHGNARRRPSRRASRGFARSS
jgi:multidrug efflux pump subunit AcrB